MNSQLKDQLNALKRAGLLKVKYPKGYKKWKATFEYWFSITKDVQRALEIMYGPGGSTSNYKGSIYCNTYFKVGTFKKGTRK